MNSNIKRDRKGRFTRAKRKAFKILTITTAFIVALNLGISHRPTISYTAQALVENSTEAAEVLAKRFVAEEVDALKDDLVIKLSDECEVKDIPEDEKDGKITFDPSPSGKAEPASIGRWQFKVKTRL
jgi:hypothetical protein